MTNTTTKVPCPQCGAALPPPAATGGRRRRFCTDECRVEWHNENSELTNEIRRQRDNARHARENAARFAKTDAYAGWLRAEARYDAKADSLQRELDERRSFR